MQNDVDRGQMTPGWIAVTVVMSIVGWFSVKWAVDQWGIAGGAILVAVELAVFVVAGLIVNSRAQKRAIEDQQRSAR